MAKLATGLTIPDTQTGLRGLPMAILSAMANVQGERFEYEMNMLLELKVLQINLTMIPIQTIYEGQITKVKMKELTFIQCVIHSQSIDVS